ncbi:MAG: hypothetical protein M1820_001874 [Bogoriella megaspora]|nr:MAG: hypothetical protein M1820_001874 [Bogoriella megaspora]
MRVIRVLGGSEAWRAGTVEGHDTTGWVTGLESVVESVRCVVHQASASNAIQTWHPAPANTQPLHPKQPKQPKQQHPPGTAASDQRPATSDQRLSSVPLPECSSQGMDLGDGQRQKHGQPPGG